MKKLLIAALAIAIVGGATFFILQSQTPEKQIIGEWVGSYEIGSFNFKEDGTVTIGFKSLSGNGEYELDSENSVISIKYSLLGISYTKDFNFILEDNILTLIDQKFPDIKLFYGRPEK